MATNYPIQKRTHKSEEAARARLPAESSPQAHGPLGYTIAGAMAASGFSRTRIYEEVAAGRLKAVKAGRRTIILASSLARLIESLPPAEIGKAAKIAAQEVRDER